MRISKGGLLVVLALLAPLLVELRTVLAWVNVELSVLESAAIGLILVVAIFVWAFWPDNGNDGPTSDSSPR
ncbi:CbaC protein [Salinadaptatus halalkaliphilus]|uniref:CbaC protein n=1 Tax=Salinadaptatus halalkaliphilus TaxID=2419781 RepID=A0A4S3TTL2_9EURY|nr:CbaC protein [Salinadaptatus halalkaliphilus]THE66753.1 CbaC protein [Salinadaptatus halalkaliphilus]